MKTFAIEGLDCAACASELEEILKGIEGVQSVSVDFVGQKVHVACDEETLKKVKDACNHFEEVKVIEENRVCFRISGLDCAACASELEEEILKIEGVRNVSVDFVGQKVSLETENAGVVNRAKDVCNHFEDVRVVEEQAAKESEHKKEILLIVISAALFIIAIILSNVLDKKFSYIHTVLFLVSYFTVGYPVLWNTLKNISKGRVFDENFLMTIASIGAMIIGEMMEGAAVMLLYQIGELLQNVAVDSSRRSIVSLMDLKSETANLIENGEIRIVDPEVLKEGDRIQIRNGEKVPVDGKIIEGRSAFDTKSLTGEALPKELQQGEEVLAGYINQGSVVVMEATHTYENSAVKKILDLVENSASKKASPEKFITRFAKIYTPVVCIIALILGVVVPLILGLSGHDWAEVFTSYLYRALILLVISCPCALIISVPLTYFGGIGACAKRGVLIKGATYLDTVSKVKVAAFDKTGTLTEGSFSIVRVEGDKKALLYAAAAEKGSLHPIARAFDAVETSFQAEDIDEIAGKGISCTIDDKNILVGNAKLLAEKGVKFEKRDSIATVIYVAEDHKLIGSIEIDDSIKEETKSALASMRSLGVNTQVMLTGDSTVRAKDIGEKLNLDFVYGDLMPDQKLEEAEELKKIGTLLYVGDGINDAPVMMCADCAVSMGKLGSDAAIEASDIVLISDQLSEVPNAIRLAKKTRKIVYENIIFSIAMKVIFMILGFFDIIPLWLAVFADVGVMLIAVINSLRMRLKVKEFKDENRN